MPHMPSGDDGRAIKFKANEKQYKQNKDQATPIVQGFLNLLARNKMLTVPIGRAGHTWVEIFLFSLACAPNLPRLLHNTTAKSSRNIGTQLTAFTKEVRELLPLILHDHDLPMFSAPKTNYNRLTNLGITTRLPHTR
eukprot:4948900-Karenia_brevis.AAC.1